MSPQYRQSVASVPSGLRGEDPFWIHMDMCDVLRQETLRLFGGLPMTHEHPPAPSAHHPQQSFDDSHLGSPSAPGYVERANDADFTLVTPSTSFYIQHDNLYVPFPIPSSLPNIMTDWTSSFVMKLWPHLSSYVRRVAPERIRHLCTSTNCGHLWTSSTTANYMWRLRRIHQQHPFPLYAD